MECGPATRSSARPHWAAVLATAFVAATLVIANLEGYHNELAHDGDLTGEPPLINWTHGWPSAFMVRASFSNLSAISKATVFAGSNEITSRWPFDDARVFAFWSVP